MARLPFSILATIASGLAGWLTYEDMSRNVRHHEESTLHDPIRELAKANGYVVAREFPLPRVPGQKGAPKQVDFVLASAERKEFVVLELKFKKTAKAMVGSVTADARKIARIDAATLNKTVEARPEYGLPLCGRQWKVHRAVLLVWREGDVAKAMLSKKEHKIIRRQMRTLLEGMCAGPSKPTSKEVSTAMIGGVPIRPVSSTGGHLRFGSTKTRKRYWVGILTRQPDWVMLPP
jgi:hypothetical protein